MDANNAGQRAFLGLVMDKARATIFDEGAHPLNRQNARDLAVHTHTQLTELDKRQD